MGGWDRGRESLPNPLALSSLGRAIVEGFGGTPTLRVLAEFGELRMLRSSLNALDFPIAILDSEGRVLVANAAAQDSSQTNESSLAAFQPDSNYLFALDSVTGDFSHYARVLANGIREVLTDGREGFTLEYCGPTAGAPRYLRVQVSPCNGGEQCRAIVTQQDISEQKQAEQARDHAQLLLDTVLEVAPSGIVIAEGPEVTIRRVNRQGRKLMSHASDKTADRSLAEYLYPAIVLRPDGTTSPCHEEFPLARSLRTGEVIRNEELVMSMPDGTQRVILCNASPVRDAAGDIQGAVAAWSDVTQRKLLIEELRQSHKMEVIGQLAGGVAHDFNNLLMVIQGYSQVLRRRLSGDPYLCSAVEEIHKATQRAAKLTQQLLAFSRKQVLQLQVLDLNTVVSNMEGMLRRTIGENIRIASVQEPELLPVKADLGQLELVILNLAVNSRDAMPRGGTIIIETRTMVVDDAMSRIHRGLSPGRYSTVVVRDTGEGMDENTKRRLFEPFFTTKEKGKGTGLGLATVYGIVKQSGGYIAVESAPDQGATFRIFLPCVESLVAGSPIPDVPLQESPTGNETILLVEDEGAVRGIVREFLQQSGYCVLQAQDGTEAIKLAQQHSPIDLLLSDVVMPGLGGRELALRMTHLIPQLRVVLMSGYAEAGKFERACVKPIPLLQKPFRLEDLGRKVREALDAAPAPPR